MSVHEIELAEKQRYLLVMKGAPERVRVGCRTIISHGEEFPTGSTYEDRFNNVYAELGGMGERVLGFCD